MGPPMCDFRRIEGDTDMAWGVAVSGALMYNSVTDGMHDAVYPRGYGGQHNVVSEHVDACLMHTSHHGELHYHTASSCIADPSMNPKATHDQDTLHMMKKASSMQPHREVYGLSKDGRPIYMPFHSGGHAYDSCDVD